jgi:hypothetical protein
MSYQEKFDNIRGGKSGLALNLVDTSAIRAADQESLVYVTVSATPVLKMALGQTYIGSLEHYSSYRIYQVTENMLAGTGSLAIEFSPCIGRSEYRLIENPSSPNTLDKAVPQPENMWASSSLRNGQYV